MKKKLVYRYYCDFCKKSGCSSYWIKHHEERCTMNPNRICGICMYSLGGYNKESLKEAKKILEPYKGLRSDWDIEGHNKVELPEEISKRIRNILDNCPACIMAALRQSDIEVASMIGFNFDQESKDMLKQTREDQADWGY